MTCDHIRSRVTAQGPGIKMWCTKPWSVYNRAQSFVKTKAKREANLEPRFNYLIKGSTQVRKYFPLRGNCCSGNCVCLVFESWPSSPFPFLLLSSRPSSSTHSTSQLVQKSPCGLSTIWPSTLWSLCRAGPSAWNSHSSFLPSVIQLKFTPFLTLVSTSLHIHKLDHRYPLYSL